MRFQEIPDAIARVGDEAGWDNATRIRQTRRWEEGARRRMAHPSAVVFLPFQRRRAVAEQVGNDEAREAAGATLRDEQGGAEYDVVLDERGRPVYFAVRAIDGALTTIDEWPRDLVALLVRQYLDGSLDARGDGDTLPRSEARRTFATRDAQPRREYIAGLIRDAHAAGVSPRAVVAAQTGKPMPTVDRWLREARAADPTLPQATRSPRRGKGTDQ